jgi:hypothetical protein
VAKAKKSAVVRVYNCSKQMIPLQLRAPGSDFFTNEQQVRIDPGKDVILPKSHLREDQIENLRKRRLIQVVYDSDTAEQSVAVTPR